MTRVYAARLNVRAPADWARRTQLRGEEALRLAAPDDDRLLVVRRLDLGRLPVGAHPDVWQDRARARLMERVAAAVHAASPGAQRAEAVWFASEAEARALLLGELAAGRTPFGWFWRLALPDWRGAALAEWLSYLLAAAEREPEQLIELARAVVKAVAAGHLVRLLAALPKGGASYAPMPRRVWQDGNAGEAPLAPYPAGEPRAALAGTPAADHFEHLPAAIRLMLIQIVRLAPPDAPGAHAMARLVVAADRPELAARPALLAHRTALLLDQAAALTAPAPDDGIGSRPLRDTPLVLPADVSRPASRQTRAADPALGTAARPAAPRAPDDGARATAEPAGPHADEEAVYRPERASAAAGLWLLVRPLARMGLETWLEARPQLAAAGFARTLLRHIAERQRIDGTDPLFGLLPDRAGAESADDLLSAWRIGLDRWLRRRTRRTLAHVVKRRGWLSPHETGVSVRFRVEQADIALRLRALDVDPGWVPWLGMSVAYRFRDEAM